MKYLRKFETEADVNMSVVPNVVLVGDTGKVIYNVLNGVFIQHIDGTLYTTDEWTAGGFTNDQANGVAVGEGAVAFVMAKEELSPMAWSSDESTILKGVFTTETVSEARKDYDGVGNTAAIAKADSSSMAQACLGYTFPNGNKGYLPAVGELRLIYGNITAIRSALTLIGGASLVTYYWSSTQTNAERVWVQSSNSTSGPDQVGKKNVVSSYGIRPFTTL